MNSILFILYIAAALSVAIYSVLRIHVLSWRASPWKMAANILMACGASLTLLAALYRSSPISLFDVIFFIGVAINSIANWDRTRCATSGKGNCRFGL